MKKVEQTSEKHAADRGQAKMKEGQRRDQQEAPLTFRVASATSRSVTSHCHAPQVDKQKKP